MLTLKRREGEELIFQINDLEFTLVVNEIKGSRVTLSVDAPRAVVVIRDELLEEA
jgi:sRNA-binding carbon storage regulator CsrA